MTASAADGPLEAAHVAAAHAATRAERHRAWPVVCTAAASPVVAFGVDWDIAWHRSIGRDSFWSPPHVVIYAAALLAVFGALARILPATFSVSRWRRTRVDERDPTRVDERDDANVRVLGFRGSLGAFIAAWGGAAMLASAPFDDWWHRAYGLDVKILSPPHVVLAIGILCLHVAAVVSLASAANAADARAPGQGRRFRRWIPAAGSMVLIALMTLFTEKIVRVHMHQSSFYVIVGGCASLVLSAAVASSRRKWAATKTAAAYSAFLLALLWTFPLVPATPRLGPVLSPVHSLIPPEFPVLLLPAAAAFDAIHARVRDCSKAIAAAACGVALVGVLLVVQWPFASFLMSAHARNFFWGARYFDFSLPSWSPYRQYRFLGEAAPVRAIGLAIAAAASALGALWGHALGRWLACVRR